MAEKIDYGDAVEVRLDAPIKYHPGAGGSTCGFRVVRSDYEANAVAEPVGTPLWLVELPNGESFEIPERFLRKVG